MLDIELSDGQVGMISKMLADYGVSANCPRCGKATQTILDRLGFRSISASMAGVPGCIATVQMICTNCHAIGDFTLCGAMVEALGWSPDRMAAMMAGASTVVN